jgi:allantoinase
VIDVVWRAARVVLPDGETTADIGVQGMRICAIGEYGTLIADRIVDYGPEAVVLPGLVDSHVHVNEPGRTAWEGFATATDAAARGGVTTIVDMPLNSIPPTVGVDELRTKRSVAAQKTRVDLGFWGGAIPGNLANLRPLHDAGVFGFKAFMLPSGVDEFPPIDDLPGVLAELATFDGLLVVHAEDCATIDSAPAAGGRSYRDFVASRPDAAELRAIKAVVDAAQTTGGRVHLLHVSSVDSLDLLEKARADGVRITAETCPHYLTFAAEDVPDGATQYKCCPPIRSAANRERLWTALRGGVLDIVVSDHSPCTPDLKNLDTGDFGTAWGGISSLQLGISAVWTNAAARGFAIADVVRWMSSGPAELIGLPAKGRLAVGADADCCVFDPTEAFVVDGKSLAHKNKITPYAGLTLTGRVTQTWLRGRQIFDSTAANDLPRTGRLLERSA